MNKVNEKQLEKWLELVISHIDTVLTKSEINNRDILLIAQKIQDLENVIDGKSKITGWRD